MNAAALRLARARDRLDARDALIDDDAMTTRISMVICCRALTARGPNQTAGAFL
jgi:hypothetical protein